MSHFVRFCKCGHKIHTHKMVHLDAKEGTWVKGGMMHIGGRAECNVFKSCSDCDCKTYRPESNIERQQRLNP